MSTLSRTRPDELDEVPIRTSSLRHWSMTSATPTMSSSSSNPFPRPHSRQTANTSVDLTNTLPSIFNSSRSSVNSSGPYQQSHCVVPDADTSPVKPRTPGFNIDDYLSSDDDSFTSPRRPRGEGEETLLFNPTGYGFGGTQLPGLEDSLAAPAPEVPNRSRSPRSSVSLPAGHLRQAYASPPPAGPQYSPARHSRARKYIIDASLDYEPEDDRYYYYSTDAAAAEDFLARILPGQPPDRRALKRLSALGSAYQQHPHLQALGLGDDVIEEERHEKIDVAEAVRLRKEVKAMKRMMAAAAAKRRSQVAPAGSGTEKPRAKGKGKERAEAAGRRKLIEANGRVRELDDEACHADVEQ